MGLLHLPTHSLSRGPSSTATQDGVGRVRCTRRGSASRPATMAKIKKAMKGGSKVAGGKKGKKGLESEQERQLRLEIERMKEEEAARQRELLRKGELKGLQAQEERYSKLNRLKILNQWRKIMRLVKVEDLRKEIEVISQSHEHEVDRKDAIIQVLDRDLEDSEEQYQMALRAHLVMVDRLIDLHSARLMCIEYEFEKGAHRPRPARGPASCTFRMDRIVIERRLQ